DLAPLGSMISSASAGNVGGGLMPSALAALRLMTNPNLVGSCTGKVLRLCESAPQRRRSGDKRQPCRARAPIPPSTVTAGRLPGQAVLRGNLGNLFDDDLIERVRSNDQTFARVFGVS